MQRYECLEQLAPLITDQLVVTSLSGQRVEWGHLSKHDGNLLLGSMGNALAVGLGLALALPKRKVIVLESDGSLLLSLFNLPTVANMNPANLAVFVFDNQAYSGTKISEPTATAGKTDLAGMARSAGIEHAVDRARCRVRSRTKQPERSAKLGSDLSSPRSKRAAVIARSREPTSICWKISISSFATWSAPKARRSSGEGVSFSWQ